MESNKNQLINNTHDDIELSVLNINHSSNQNCSHIVQEFHSIVNELEDRLEQIETNEREFEQRRRIQLEKNRQFWDEYRRQVENYSNNRIKTLQYEYKIRQNQNEIYLQRLKIMKFLFENQNQIQEEIEKFHLFPSSLSFLNEESFIFLFSSKDFSFENLLTNCELDHSDLLNKLKTFDFLDRIII